MARSNTVKRFHEKAWYHVYNRGINKQAIFFDTKDYWSFRRSLKHGLDFVDDRIQIAAFALLENHFHLLVFQENSNDLTRFMRSAMGKYSAFIRQKYKRTGFLYESIYKARLIENESLLKVKNYILANPIEAGLLSWKHVGTQL